jgi:hypothetical protein
MNGKKISGNVLALKSSCPPIWNYENDKPTSRNADTPVREGCYSADKSVRATHSLAPRVSENFRGSPVCNGVQPNRAGC